MKIIPENVITELGLEIPLDWQLSKNRSKTRHKYTGKTVYNANQSKIDVLRDTIYYLSKGYLIKREFRPKTKTWVFITAHKKDNRGDVANLVDAISDAVKKAILIDDCYFSFILDQIIDGKETIEIRILQES